MRNRDSKLSVPALHPDSGKTGAAGPISWRKAVRVVGLLSVAFMLTGCIRSRVMMTSEPSGAEVTWQGDYRGVTPIEIPIIWYWYYDYSVEKEGYVPIEKVERFRTPPWFLLPLDLFAELIPFPFPDRRERHYVLEEEPEVF